MSLQFRATVFLRPTVDGEPVTLMERHFAKEGDAVTWCRVMTEAQPQASGLWFVAAARNGRVLALAREAGIAQAIEAIARGAAFVEPELSEEEASHLAGESDLPARGVVGTLMAANSTPHVAVA